MNDTDKTRPIEKEEYLEKARFKIVVPANLDALTSSTSYCENCFRDQMFSKKLQRFMIDYAIKVNSKNPLTDK